MKNSAFELLLLMTSLTQFKDEQKVVSIAIESMNEIFPDCNLIWAEYNVPDGMNRIEVCTRNRSYGFIAYTESKEADNELTALLHNSGQMLGAILEKLRQEKELIIQNKKLESIAKERTELAEQLERRVVERTAELESANKSLIESRLEAVKNMEEAINAKKLAEEAAVSLEQEIEEREAVEDSLENERYLLENIMETSPVGITTVDISGRISYANSTAIKIFGLSKKESFQRSFNTPLWHITDLNGGVFPEDKLPLRQILKKGKPATDIRHAIEWPDGKKIALSINAAPLKDGKGNLTGMVAAITDITESLKSEKSLRELHFRQETMISNIADVITIISGDDIITYKSPNCLKWFGWLPDELTEKSVWENVHPDDLEKTRSFFRTLNSPESTGKIECRYRCKNGNYTWIEFTGVNLLHDPNIRGILGNYHDISERKLSEEKIIQSLHEKELLLLEIYHRTNNTMQVIKGMLALQAAKYPDSKELKIVVKSTEDRIQAISLVHKMLYTTKDLSQISIKEYIERLSELIYKSFGASQEKINLTIKSDEIFVLIDTAIPFGLILNELMTNSLKYAFPGDRTGEIKITLDKDAAGTNILNYSDNGIGTAADFNLREQNTLGLKLIYSLGEQQMKGKISMQTRNGFSCSFEFKNNLYIARV